MLKGVCGRIKKDRRTKCLIPRLKKGEIALIAHANIDELAAKALLEKKVKAVLNTEESLTGDFVVHGAELLLKHNIPVLDGLPSEWMESVKEGEVVRIDKDKVFLNGEALKAHLLSMEEVRSKLAQARAKSLKRFEDFVENTLQHLRQEKAWLFPDFNQFALPFSLEGREVVVVVRGKNYKEDLRALIFFIRERKPVLIGVDGGADALCEAGFSPEIVVGDMDSASKEALSRARHLIAHAYPDGDCPAKKRLEQKGFTSYFTVPFAGTSEDLALMLAYAAGAARIVGVGMHFSMDEFLQKGREGMASTVLTRMRVGNILFDAKGVSEIYRPSVPKSAYCLLLFSIFFTAGVILLTSPYIAPFFQLFRLYLKQMGKF